MSNYWIGSDVIVESVGVETKPALTPAQLAVIDRALTPEEQKLVDAWQAGEAESFLKSVRATGGPTATMEVTAKGASLTKTEFPKWASLLPVAVLSLIGVIGIGATIALFAKSKWGWALVNFLVITPVVATGAAVVAKVAIKPRKLV